MANRTVTVKSSGGDYTSLNAAFAGEDDTYADLVTNTMILTFECYNFEDTTAATTGTAWTTSSSYYLNIVAHDSHAGKWSTNAYRLSVSNTTCLTLSENYITVDGLQIKITATSDVKYGIYVNGQSSSTNVVTVKKCIIVGALSSGATAVHGCISDDSGTGYPICKIYNSLVYNFYNSSYLTYRDSSGIKAVYGHLEAYNCTVSKCSIGFKDLNSTYYIKAINCLSNCDDSIASSDFIDFSGTLTNSDYNASHDTTAPGANSHTGHTFTFLDFANNDFHLASNDTGALDLGTDLSGTFTDDIDGQTRSGTWDIGADEYVAAAAARPLPTRILTGPFIGPFEGCLQ